jgi:uncharacterized integral membrane protein
MLPGFDNLRMESFMPIHEGFKSMQDDQESFTADEIDKIHSEEDDFADIQTIKPTDAQIKSKSMAKDNGNKAKEPVTVNTEEDDTKEFITKYIESEEVEEPETTTALAKNNKASPTTKKEDSEKEGFQGSMITQMGTNKLILVTLLITMVSFVLNMGNTRNMNKNWLKCGTKATLCISVILALLVFVILRIFC